MSNPAPIRAYFGQTKYGESRLWSWLTVFWFAIVIWFYSQLILSIPIFVAGSFADPDHLDNLIQASSQSTDISTSITKGTLAITMAIGLPTFAILLFLLRNRVSNLSRPILLKCAGLLAVFSFIAIVYIMAASGADSAQMEIINSWLEKSPVVYLCILLSFPPIVIGLWIGQKYIHRRTILSLHTATKRFRWGRMLFTMCVFWLIAMGTSVLAHFAGISTMEFVFDPSRFWIYLPITLLFIPMQSATEEIMLRGYLNQGLAHHIKDPGVVFLITSAGFAALHLGNPEVVETTKDHSILIAMSGYFFFGLFACLLTYIDGGLESAIGMHAANNMFAAAIVGYENSALPTPTIFRVPLNSSLDGIMVILMLSLLCLILFMTRKPLELGDPPIYKTDQGFQ